MEIQMHNISPSMELKQKGHAYFTMIKRYKIHGHTFIRTDIYRPCLLYQCRRSDATPPLLLDQKLRGHTSFTRVEAQKPDLLYESISSKIMYLYWIKCTNNSVIFFIITRSADAMPTSVKQKHCCYVSFTRNRSWSKETTPPLPVQKQWGGTIRHRGHASFTKNDRR